MSKYQGLCYCSLAKPDPHTKGKSLVSQDRYGIVFMHGQNVMADGRELAWYHSPQLSQAIILSPPSGKRQVQ